ncbi:sensor histidine kinase [Bifidobacterium pullorum]|uniref:sensor histidine kinase n=1 Tax=Bifidobacterium pullorum TaxID=78448 RepID=UPI0024AD5F05|nr:hypothetical protein [Bifidobacterium pullorum]
MAFFVVFSSMFIFPVPSAVVLSLYFAVTCGIVPFHGSGELLCMAYSLGMLVYDTSLRFGTLITVPIMAGIYVQSCRFPEPSWSLALNSAPVLVFLMLLILNFGQTSRNRSKLLEMRLKTERAEELGRRVEVARMIHDSVTGDLSNIARVSQRQLRRCEDLDEREVWRQINEQSVRVLDGVHAVIRQLSETGGEDSDRSDDSAEGLAETLNARSRMWQQRLAESGIEGDVRVIDHIHRTMPFTAGDAGVRQSYVLAMLDEAFTNIMRHGRYGADAYTVAVTLGERHVELVAMNDLRDDGKTNVDIDDVLDLPGGNGLRLHREQIETLNGVMSVGEEDDSWVLYVRVPYAEPDHSEPSRLLRRS